MRIAILVWESLHSVRVGGLAVVATRLAEEMAKRGHEVHFFTRAAEGQTEYQYISGVHYHRCKFDPGLNLLWFAHNMSEAMVSSFREVERRMGKFDIVHGHDWHVVDALHELKNAGYPVVLTFHSTEYGRNGGRFGDWWEYREVSGKEWYGAYIANRVTTVSNAMKNELCWLYQTPADKIDVIPNAVDPRGYKVEVDRGRIKERYGVDPLAPTVLYAGRMEYQKGPDMLVEAIPEVLRNVWDVKFVLAGDGGMKGHLEHRTNQLGISRATKFLGGVPYWRYIEVLNSCDMVCIPSRNEPFGIILLEAWAAGKPPVATDVGGLGENIENFVDGIKVYPNPGSIAWGINYLLSSPGIMKRITKGGKEKVKRFSWGNAMDKLMSTYNAVLKGV